MKILFFLNILLGIGVFYPIVQANAEAEWKIMPLRTAEQKAAQLLGGEGFQQIQALVYAPADPRVVYMATDTSQIWKSLDGGVSWKPAGTEFPNHGAASLFVDPKSKDLVLAAGFLGERFPRAKKNKNRIQGIYRSIDGGKTWDRVKTTDFFRQTAKGQLFSSINYKGRRILYCGTWNDGLLESHDEGRNWVNTGFREKRVRDIAPFPGDKNSLLIACQNGLFHYAASGHFSRIENNLPSAPLNVSTSSISKKIIYAVCGDPFIYLSDDLGRTFHKCTPQPLVQCAFYQIEVNPSDNRFAVAFTYKSSFCNGIWCTRNGGKSWHRIKHTANDSVLPKKRLGQWMPGPVAFHPSNPAVALIGINGYDTLLRTEDRGRSWHYSASGFCGGRMKDMAFPEKGHSIISLTDFGLWESKDNGGTFKPLDTGRLDGQMSSSSIAAQGGRMLASLGTWHQKGIVRTMNYGETWNRIKALGKGDFHEVAIHAQKKNVMYAGSYRSTDGGLTWKKLEIEILAAFPGNHDIIYGLRDENGGVAVWRSPDQGDHWVKISRRLSLSRNGIRDMDVHPNDPEKILLATSKGVAILHKGSWCIMQEAAGLARDASGACFVEKIEFDPRRPALVYAGRRSPGNIPANGVFRSDDGGKKWKSINRNLPEYLDVFGLKINPYDGSVFIGTSLGTYVLQE